VADRPFTSVLYEAPHRVARTIAELAAACGAERPLAVGRELTKVHEQLWRGTLGQAVSWLADSEPKGEWVLVVGGALVEAAQPTDEEVVDALRARIDGGADRRHAVADVAAELRLPKRDVYQLSIDLAAPDRT
jgi:16S rRNA (cytidine1402-2'-O)-methyltransferase